MLYNFLNTNKNSHFFFLYGLGALQIILYRYLLIGLPIEPISLAETLVMCLLLLINISTISFIIRKNQLSEGNLLVVFFWIVISMLFPEVYKDYTVMLANTCILFVILQVMQSHNITDGRQVFFDISVLISLLASALLALVTDIDLTREEISQFSHSFGSFCDTFRYFIGSVPASWLGKSAVPSFLLFTEV